ncbi:hypothetical protein GRJ2_003096500 [Grus japonensis]|uniref:Uncharacterized protein n=1 Tax=Grus japonensis TaxID=30415 RepID=A0ABC9Y8C3_GRUJA
MGISNGIDAEVLANKLAAATKDVQGLQHPLRSSLSALGANQWLLSDILPQWKQINENDHEIILEALDTAQSNISLALSYIQAQLRVQSVASAIIREGEEGVLPSEVHKVIWDNANEFEKEFQSWWQVMLLEQDDVELKVTSAVNPAMFLAMNEESEESLSHDCLQTIEEVYSSRSDLHDELLTNPDLELFTDGSSFVQDGKRRAGYAVVTTTEVVEAEALPSTRRRRKRN